MAATSLSLLAVLLLMCCVTAKKPTVGYEKERPRWEKVLQPYSSALWLADGRTRSVIWRASGVPDCVWEVNLLQKDDNDTETSFYKTTVPNKDVEELIRGKQKIDIPVPRNIQSGSYYIGVECEKEQIDLRGESFRIIGREVYEGEGKTDQHVKRARELFKKTEDYFKNIDLENLTKVKCTIPILTDPSRLEFEKECANKACVIRGLTGRWPANKKWSLSKMKEDARLSFGLSMGNNSIQPGLIQDLWKDDMSKRFSSQPMIFMNSFQDQYPELSDDYEVPALFQEDLDLFSALPQQARMDWHWIIIAPSRSGSYWHIDPFNTTAWNALISGKKRWATYPPETFYIPGTRHNDLDRQSYKEETDNTYFWFSQTLPYIKPQRRPQECIQEAGDVMFMPEGWWHTVLNVEDTVAVTQNFLRESARQSTVKLLRRSQSQTSKATLKAMAEKYTDIYPGLFEEGDTMDTDRLNSEDLQDFSRKFFLGEKLRWLGKSEEMGNLINRR